MTKEMENRKFCSKWANQREKQMNHLYSYFQTTIIGDELCSQEIKSISFDVKNPQAIYNYVR